MLKEVGKLAEKYAMAVFEIADEQNMLDGVKDELALMRLSSGNRRICRSLFVIRACRLWRSVMC